MVDVAQLVRASDCGSEGRGFEPHLPPKREVSRLSGCFATAYFFCWLVHLCKHVANLQKKRAALRATEKLEMGLLAVGGLPK